MKTIYYSVFLISLTLSAASNNNTYPHAHFVRLKELHTLGGSLALGQVTDVYNRIEGDGKYFGTAVVLGHNSSLRIYPGRGLAFAATLLDIDKKAQQEVTLQDACKKARIKIKTLTFQLKEAQEIHERLAATVQELRAKNDLLSSSNDQFSTPPSSPTNINSISKSPSQNNLITLILSLFTILILS